MRGAKTALAVAASATLAVVLVVTIIPALTAEPDDATSPAWLGEALWRTRGLDLTVQALILLVGSLAVMLLLREDRGGDRHG
ncbi:MAG TPA: hypothetical protein VIL45_02525 [Thermoplasmata archaeon]|nr:hypothetical protein [Thermoplasmata archaeon]HLA46393.1 hypothetical protein [Thermoplasmata archaeon]